MGISQSAIARLYFSAFFLGCAFGLFYDCLRISRILFGAHYSASSENRFRNLALPLIGNRPRRKHYKMLGVVIFIEDFLFSVIAGIAMILLFYEVANGEIRYLAFIFASVGLIVYRVTLGKPIMLLAETLAFVLECAIRYVIWFLLLPIRSLRKLLKRIYCAYREKKNATERRRYTEKMMKRVGIPTMETRNGKEHRGGKRKKKTVQPEPSVADISRSHDHRVTRGVRQ